MSCFEEKVELGAMLAAGVVAVGGTGLASSTPAVILGLIGTAAAGAKIGLAIIKLANCLEQHGQPEMARTLRETAEKIRHELELLKEFAEKHGIHIDGSALSF
jgi:hypothetical protein